MGTEVIWLDERERGLFEKRGLNSFESFWHLENSGADIEYRELSEEKKGRNFRSVCAIRFEQNIKYFLKRATGSAVDLLKNEYGAFSLMVNFGFRVPRVICYAFDEVNNLGVLLMKSLAGFVCLEEIFKGDFRPELVAEYRMKEEQILSNLARGIISYQRAGYFYKELKLTHVYVNPFSAEVALIDLENFIYDENFPFYYRFSILKRLIHSLERRNLLCSIQKYNRQSARALKRILKLAQKRN